MLGNRIMSVPLPMTFMSISMEKPLNQAHKQERIAEVHLMQGRYDEAEHYFQLAAKFMREAMKGVKSEKIALPLRMQAEKLEKMKDVIEIKRKEQYVGTGNSRSPPKHEEHSSPTKHHQDPRPKEKWTNVSDKAMQFTGENNTPAEPAKEVLGKADKYKWQMVPNNIQQLIEERETDSLLQFLNFPADDPLGTSSSCRKMDKNDATIIEEYKTRVNILQDTALRLLKALDQTETENRSLRQNVEELQDEVNTLTDRLACLQGNTSPQSFHYQHFDNDVRSEEFLSGKFTTDTMIASIIVQPESFFEMEKNLEDAAAEFQDIPHEGYNKFKSMPATIRAHKSSTKKNKLHQPNAKDPALRLTDPIDCSIKYEDLDDDTNEEIREENFHSLADFMAPTGSSPQLRNVSIAGLPPLSPVHFELNENDDIL